MAQASKTFRVFVSSTFRDLVKERNALQAGAFTNLQRRCEAEGARFQAIDLRWGISDEASLDQQTIPICLAEVERCQNITPRPNFVVLLGDRYGWRALPTAISADEWDRLRPRVTDAGDATLLDRWYRRDDNAVPPEYVLQPREAKLPENPTDDDKARAEAADRDEWGEVERELRRILLAAIEGLGLTDDQRVKYEKSATEQEIRFGALGKPDAHEHVFCFFRTIDGVPTDGSASDLYDGTEDDQRDLTALKEELGRHLVSEQQVQPYRASWVDGEVGDGHLEALSDAVEAALWSEISSQLARMRLEQLEGEIASHREFGDDRARHFTGRVEIIDSLRNYAMSGSGHPLAVFGASGSGKTALMAKVAQEVVGRPLGAPEEQRKVHPDTAAEEAGASGERVVVRFIGATPESSDIRRLLASVCQEISRRYGADEATPADYRELVQELPNRLALATADRPLVIFLDALDQLSDAENARSLVWLPRELPEHVRVVVSTLTDPPECFNALRAKLPDDSLVELTELPENESDELLDKWLADAHRTLTTEQRTEVLGKLPDEGRVLYLKLAYEEARRWHSYDEPTDRTPLSTSIEGVIRDNLFARLREPENHGPTMVERSLAYLAAGKNGMSEDEMLKVLSANEDVVAEFKERSPEDDAVRRRAGDQLPIVVWSRLYLDLEPYLSSRQTDGAAVLSFYHRQLRKVVEDDYLAGDDGTARHRELAGFFAAQPFDIESAGETAPNVRKLVELPYQQTTAQLWDDVYNTLTDFEFLEKKVAHVGIVDNADGTHTYTGVYQLQDDYALALERMPGGDGEGGTDKRRTIILTGVDFHDGKGLVIRCPHCNTVSPFQEGWRGRDIKCPNEKCKGPLHINKFAVGESALEMQ